MKLGQKVVCVDASGDDEGSSYLIQGRVYVVRGMRMGCCVEEVDVGLIGDWDISVCSICGQEEDTRVGWSFASRFRPLEEKSETMIETVLESIREKV